ncbi:hypothetical protein JG688_00004984 [Phytophthora aleatoria]|uniref:Uncharacterized protein n=1 Tax=Phytophthora aleatoria TaxID=2496075 RepID=A0A8J5MH30_9STRA|nr:hypothetical protein JG688_00004984 [Phytophthora aleatoria]
MLSKRPRVLYFHVRDSLSPTVLRILDELVTFMHDNARSFWEIVHCLTVKTQGQTPEERASLSSSVQLYTERTYPAKICYLFLMDPRTLGVNGQPYVMRAQLDLADATASGRTMSNCGEHDHLAQIPEKFRDRILVPSIRAWNWVSEDYEDW